MKSFAYLLGGGGVVLQDLQPQTQLQLPKETLSIKILKLDLKFYAIHEQRLDLKF
jgi:hypothetical protein